MSRLVWLGVAVIFLGFVMILAGTTSGGSASFGGAVFIGPFPIAFGSGPEGGDLALISVVIGGIMVILTILWGWRVARRE